MSSNSGEKSFRQKVSEAVDILQGKTMNPEFQKLQEMLSSAPNSDDGGEVIVRFDSGETVEFHQHDTVIHDQDVMIEREASDGVVWYDGSKIEALWIHRESVDDL